MNEDDPERTPVYPTEADRQCLKLSEKLFAVRLERDQLADQLRETALELVEARATIENLKYHLNGYEK